MKSLVGPPAGRGRARRSRRVLALSVLAAFATLSPALVAESAPPDRLDVSVFAEVGSPGHPEGVVVGLDGTVYVGTHMDATEVTTGPSHIFAYDSRGILKREYVIEGQAAGHAGLLGLAMDGDGLIYAMDRDPARVITIDPRTGEQRDYATFADVPPCSTGAPRGRCSATVGDRPAMADDPVFAPDGSLYVTDINQALIWRIPPGGGAAHVWFTAPELESVFGPNGIRFIDNGRTLMFAQTLHEVTDPADIYTGQGRLYTLRVRPDGSPGALELFWEGQPGEGLDGFAVGASGKIYAAMALPGALLVLSPDGTELSRAPATPQANAQQQPPFDLPASVAFAGRRVLVTNQVYFGGPPERDVVFTVYVGEFGRPLFRP